MKLSKKQQELINFLNIEKDNGVGDIKVNYAAIILATSPQAVGKMVRKIAENNPDMYIGISCSQDKGQNGIFYSNDQ